MQMGLMTQPKGKEWLNGYKKKTPNIIGRTDVEAATPILWAPDVKS